MATLRGRIWDRAGGRPLEARVQVLAANGSPLAPPDAIKKVGPGQPFFYADGSFEVESARGQVDVLVERGTEYRPFQLTLDAPPGGAVDVDVPLERWINPPSQGLYAGNTHVHYDERETRPDERLRLDPRVEDLPVLIVSVLKRRELAYASNAFPIGRHAHSNHEHVIDVGEESRHNYPDNPWRIGLGHIMLVNIERLIEPVSRGILVDDSSPDYPPMVDACDGARAQGGTVLWCHNANGMEAPVAAVLGKLDGLNLHDPYWMDPEYDLWYRLLDCGIRLPASTGSDWFVCSSNRVYVDVRGLFSYEAWLAGMRAGRTFVTDGPILHLSVEGHEPSNEVIGGRGVVEAVVDWQWQQPVDRVELLCDGEVVAVGGGGPVGRMTARIDAAEAGWIAARCAARQRNSYGHALWAHTSPVYLRPRPAGARARAAAAYFVQQLDLARDWVATKARFDQTAQRDRMLQLFVEGRAHYERLTHA